MNDRPLSFTVEESNSNSLARAGKLITPHGSIETPAFMAVATKATIKGVMPETVSALGIEGIIANAYHLYLEPGEEQVSAAGGLGNYMHWEGPTMTDSGGFQIFSLGEGFGRRISKFLPEERVPEEAVAIFDEDLATSHGKLAIVDDEGVSFTSHIDGSLHRFTPERSIEIQHKLGADIIFAFDECTAPDATYAYQREAAHRTHAWASRSLAAHRLNLDTATKQGIYGIVQGGRYRDLRIESARTLSSMDFDGYGIGGSFSKHDILGILDAVNRELPDGKPRHLLGIGEPEDIFIAISSGIDTFDCVLPTRNGRAGTLYTNTGKINIENAAYRSDNNPIDSECHCLVCQNYSRAYLSHLFRAREMLGPILASTHNLYFLAHLTKKIRKSIFNGSFEDYKKEFFSRYRS